MVDVGMREHHGIDCARLIRQLLVDPIGVVAPALIQAAIQQQTLARGGDEVLRSGDSAGSAPECDIHLV